jgi:outer membrane protein TolC
MMSRKRWIKRVLAGLLALGNTIGCKQQVFMEPQDYHDAIFNTLPKGIDTKPHEAITPSRVDKVGQSPANVLDPDRPARMITLKECIAIALEQGNVGFQTPTNLGSKLEVLPSFSGRTLTGTDSIRAYSIDPSVLSAELERSLSKFDAQWINSVTWQKVDTPTAAQFLSFQNNRDVFNITSTLVKPLPTGGIAGITFQTDYSKYGQGVNTSAGFVNPNYIPQVLFTFEQPLLRLFGVEANQLAPNHPGSQLLNIQPSGGSGTEGILISRIRVDEQKADFERVVNFMMVNVEVAYWNLFAAYYNLYAQEEGLRQAYGGYRFTELRVQVGSDPSQNLDQSRAQFWRFRRQVYDARGQVLEAERQLRGLLGLRSDDGTRLVPIDEPNLAPFVPDFYEAANDALANRPELLQCRMDLKAQQLNLLLQKYQRRPDLRFVSQYNIAGLGTRLDGSLLANEAGTVPGNALTSLAQNRFNNWTLGFRLTMPIGFRDANALVREGQLGVARSYYQLRDTEMKVLEYLVQQYRQVIQTHADIGPARAERQSLQLYIAKTEEVIRIGRWNPQDFLNFLTVQQQLASAIATEFQAIANYNNALATFEFAKGTIKQYNNVTVGEGPLPPWASKKAADHIRERTQAALKLRERDTERAPSLNPAIGGQEVGPPVGNPLLGQLPPFAENRPPLPDSIPEAPAPTEPRPMPLPQPVPNNLIGTVQPWPGTQGASSTVSNAAPWTAAGPGQPAYAAPQGQPQMIAPLAPRQNVVPMSVSPSSPTMGTTPRAPAGDDYFRPSGSVGLPPRGTTGSGATQPRDAVQAPASPSPLQLPVGSGMPPLSIPLAGTTAAPPIATGTVEFGPATTPISRPEGFPDSR